MAELDAMIEMAINAVAEEASPELKAIFTKAIKKMDSEGIPAYEALGFTKQHLEGIYTRAFELHGQGKYKEASNILEQLVILDPTRGKYLLGLGACYLMQKQYESALYAYLRASRIDTVTPIPLYNLADCFAKLGHKGAALIVYDQVLNVIEDNPFFQHLKPHFEKVRSDLRHEIRQPYK